MCTFTPLLFTGRCMGRASTACCWPRPGLDSQEINGSQLVPQAEARVGPATQAGAAPGCVPGGSAASSHECQAAKLQGLMRESDLTMCFSSLPTLNSTPPATASTAQWIGCSFWTSGRRRRSACFAASPAGRDRPGRPILRTCRRHAKRCCCVVADSHMHVHLYIIYYRWPRPCVLKTRHRYARVVLGEYRSLCNDCLRRQLELASNATSHGRLQSQRADEG